MCERENVKLCVYEREREREREREMTRKCIQTQHTTYYNSDLMMLVLWFNFSSSV